ncbi:MAG: hypothetical protein L3K19_00970 [Thermoplasmata archaeon]|nr:hypothetical protein [Thermoplasmata archaeon]
MSVSLSAGSAGVSAGTPVTLHTTVHVVRGSPAHCADVPSFYYTGLPTGLVPSDSPVISGYVYVPGVFHVAVVVVASNGHAIGHLTLAVAGGP